MEKEKSKIGRIVDAKIIKRLYAYTKPYRFTFYSVVLLTLLIAVLGPIRPYLVQYAVDNYMVEGKESLLLQITWVMIALLILQTLVQYAHTYYSGWLGQTIIKDIRLQLYQKILSLRLKFFDKTDRKSVV